MMVCLLFAQIPYDIPELLQRRLQVFHDLPGDNVGFREVVRGFKNGNIKVRPRLDFKMSMRESCELPYKCSFY
jgi:hypothetical protein